MSSPDIKFDKEQVKIEIQDFSHSLDAALINPNLDDYAGHFSNSEDFTVRTQTKLLTSYDAVIDTMRAHF